MDTTTRFTSPAMTIADPVGPNSVVAGPLNAGLTSPRSSLPDPRRADPSDDARLERPGEPPLAKTSSAKPASAPAPQSTNERGASRERPNTMHPSYSRVEIRPVTNRRERDQFIQFAWTIYAHDKQWCPPLWVEARAFIDRRKHPFYEHGDAAQFLALRDGVVVGRIMASDDPRYNAEHGTNTGCFGLFECLDDQGVADALLSRAAEWCRERGRAEIMGPIDYSTNYPCGLLLDGFDTPQRVMMNHNPLYYAKLLENWRLAKAKDLYAWWFDDSADMLDRWARLAGRFAKRGNVTIRPLSFKNFEVEVSRCQQVYNEAWETSWGFVKMSDAEFRHMAKHLKQLAEPELMLLAEVDGQPAGFCVTLPDFNEATRPLNGRLTNWGLPIGLVRLMRNLRKIRTARMAVLGVIEQFRRRGVAELFILRALEVGRKKLHYTGAELGWTLEDNELINRTIEKVGGQRYKTFRIYAASI